MYVGPPLLVQPNVSIAGVLTFTIYRVELLQALVNNAEGHRLIVRMVNRETVDVARNRLAAEAIATANDPELLAPGTDPYVFWIDSDPFQRLEHARRGV